MWRFVSAARMAQIKADARAEGYIKAVREGLAANDAAKELRSVTRDNTHAANTAVQEMEAQMTIDDDKFQEFVRFYASYTESSEEWAEKVRRFRASKLYAKMAGEECLDVEQPDIENFTYEDGSKYATTNDHRRTPRPGAPEI